MDKDIHALAKEVIMDSLTQAAIAFGGAAASYGLLYERHDRWSHRVRTDARRGTGSEAYRKVEWAQGDVDEVAIDLEQSGRTFVNRLAPFLRAPVEEAEVIISVIEIAGSYRIRTRTQDETPQDDLVDVIFCANKAHEDPRAAPTPIDWLRLAAAVPALLLSVGAYVEV